MNFIKTLILLFFLSINVETLANNLVIIVNKDHAVDTLNKKQVIDIYMGRQAALSKELQVKPIDLESTLDIKREFYQKLVNQDLRKINAYWARLLFSARAKPPMKAESIEDAVNTVSKSVDKIAYVPESAVNDEVKVVFRLDNVTFEANSYSHYE